jgi:ribosomal protein S18 acetylase RimI-like enzyme
LLGAWSAVSGEDRTFSVQNAQGVGGASGHDPAWPQIIPLADLFSQRPATVADNDFLLALFAESRPDLALLPEAVRGQLIRMQFDSQLSQYRASAPDAVDWILELDSGGRIEPVGRCYVERGADEHRLLDIAIRFQWRRHGLGSIVLARLCADAAQAGVPLRLSVWHANSDALRLYHRIGFVADDPNTGNDGDISETTGYLRLRWSAEGGQ